MRCSRKRAILYSEQHAVNAVDTRFGFEQSQRCAEVECPVCADQPVFGSCPITEHALGAIQYCGETYQLRTLIPTEAIPIEAAVERKRRHAKISGELGRFESSLSYESRSAPAGSCGIRGSQTRPSLFVCTRVCRGTQRQDMTGRCAVRRPGRQSKCIASQTGKPIHAGQKLFRQSNGEQAIFPVKGIEKRIARSGACVHHVTF